MPPTKPARFTCNAYVDVRSNVAIFGEYTVRDCREDIVWTGRLVSGSSDRFPSELERQKSADFGC